MWLFTEQGFLSVVAYDEKFDSNTRSKRQSKSFGKRPVLVRGRRKEHLEQLKPYWSKLRIETDTSADYSFRAVMPRARWVEFLADAGNAIDYDSHFKEVVQDRGPGTYAERHAFHSVMMSVWSSLATLQPTAPYSGSEWFKNYQENRKKGKDGKYQYSAYAKTYDPANPPFKSAKDSASVFAGGEALIEPPAQITGTSVKTYAQVSQCPDTLEQMTLALTCEIADDVWVDPATPALSEALWGEALNLNLDRPLTPEEVANILNDLCSDPVTDPHEAEQFYMAYIWALEKFDLDEERLIENYASAYDAAYDVEQAQLDLDMPVRNEAVRLMIAD